MFKSLFFLLFVFLLVNVESKPNSFIKTNQSPLKGHLKQKLSHLHFYLHDVVSGPKPSAMPISKAINNLTLLGMTNVMDDHLTQGPSPKSTQLGRAQGFYASVGHDEVALFMAVNLYFTIGKYNGSVLTVLGRNAVMNPVREMPVIGGSGLFRFATGFALATTYWFDLETGDAIVEYNVTVTHY